MKVLIIWGGWEGHNPKKTADKLGEILAEKGDEVRIESNFGILLNENLSYYDVLIPVWSCGIKGEYYLSCLSKAVKEGLGLALIHGAIDWFDQKGYYEIAGGLYLSDKNYDKIDVEFNEYMPEGFQFHADFKTKGEFYHLMSDSKNTVLANAKTDGGTEPYAWIKRYGNGRVFFTVGAHRYEDYFSKDCIDLILDGINWCSRKKET